MSDPDLPSNSLNLLDIGGPSALLDVGCVRLLTDSTFDSPGDCPDVADRLRMPASGEWLILC